VTKTSQPKAMTAMIFDGSSPMIAPASRSTG